MSSVWIGLDFPSTVHLLSPEMADSDRAMLPADALVDDFDQIYAQYQRTWLDKVSEVCGDPNKAKISTHLTDDDMYKALGFKDDYDWSTTVVFKFQVDSADGWIPLMRYVKKAGIAFGGWSRTNIEYVHLFKADTVDDADELVNRGDVEVEGIPCKILPLCTVGDAPDLRGAE